MQGFRNGLVFPHRSVWVEIQGCAMEGAPSCLGTVVVGEGCRALPMEKAQAVPEESHSGDEGGKYTHLMQLLSGLLLDTA